MSAKNKEIKKAIDSLDLDEARKLLKTALKQNPDADTYYFASLVALNDNQKQDFLKKAIELDPFHQEANTELNGKPASKKSTSENNVKSISPNASISPWKKFIAYLAFLPALEVIREVMSTNANNETSYSANVSRFDCYNWVSDAERCFQRAQELTDASQNFMSTAPILFLVFAVGGFFVFRAVNKYYNSKAVSPS